MDYDLLCEQLRAMIHGVPEAVSNLANAAALLYDRLERVNWAGFYLYRRGALYVGPYQGKPACTKISVGRGVCGTAFQKGETLVVPDVHQFPGHIACDAASNSEIVLPMFADGQAMGVLDLDSMDYDRFSEADRAGLEAFVRVLLEELAGQE